MPDLEKTLRARRDGGGRAFVPYVTGGFPGVDAALLRSLQNAGADAVEVGIPFSDPVMDGGVIQEASRLALEAGARPSKILGVIAEASLAFYLDATPWEIGASTHAHPTFSEILGEAAMAVDGRSINF